LKAEVSAATAGKVLRQRIRRLADTPGTAALPDRVLKEHAVAGPGAGSGLVQQSGKGRQRISESKISAVQTEFSYIESRLDARASNPEPTD
jgi:hypothetical protein